MHCVDPPDGPLRDRSAHAAANLSALMKSPRKWVHCVRQAKPIKMLILDLDSLDSQTYGQQDHSEYNGYFCCEYYLPIFCFNQDWDVEAALLRNDNVAIAHDWCCVMVPVIDRYRDMDIAKLFRVDEACAISELSELLETEGAVVRSFGGGLNSLRVSPNLMTSEEQLDHFLDALAARGA